MSEPKRRSGAETRAEAQRVALALFSSKGYEATSLREIAEHLGISKASLYYHFPSKEAIVRAGLTDRGDEAGELLAWVQQQPWSPDLVDQAVMRWVDSLSVDKLRGIRFILANPVLMRNLASDRTSTVPSDGGRIRDGLEAVVEIIAGPDADATRTLLIRMAILSINSAVMAASGTERTDDEIIEAARAMAVALLAAIRHA